MNECYDGVEYSLPLLVVGSKGTALLGRKRLEKIKLNWPILKQLPSQKKLTLRDFGKTCSAVREGP